MRFYLLATCFITLLFSVDATAISNYPASCLRGKIETGDKRYKTFYYVLREMEKRNARVIVETGTARNGRSNCAGDGCSTCVFADWASKNNAIVYSVDINERALFNAQASLGDEKECVYFIHSDSVEFLENFNDKIDFLYLDSYDFEVHNPHPSQLHHLREVEAAYPFLKQDSIIMIDDCNLPHGGKGALAIDYLLKRGWRIVLQDYQVVLVRN